MESKEIAIRLSGVKKRYRLGQIGGGTLQGDLQSWWARVRGKEDPNVRLGLAQDSVGQIFMALDGIDLTVYRGQALGIIGNNGAGKSTLLKLLSRVTAPTEGEIDIYGRISSMLEVGTGFNAQMTGRENIYLNGAILGMTKAEIDSKMEDIIEFSEVRDFIDTPVKRYSSGMFVKLAFAVAAHLNSEIIIMDEVLAVGDMAFQKKCLEKMREAAQENGRTVLYVSHNMNTIRELCDRCIVLEKGKILYDGEVEQAISLYMNRSIDDNEVDMDLSGKLHTGHSENTGLRMLHLTMPDKTLPMFTADENLNLLFTLRTTTSLSGVSLRLSLRSNTDQPIGTAWSDPLDLPEAENLQLYYSFPLEHLARGDYYASIGFYRTNEAGQPVTLDHITRAFRLTMRPSDPYWSTSAHGYVTFSGLKGRLL